MKSVSNTKNKEIPTIQQNTEITQDDNIDSEEKFIYTYKMLIIGPAGATFELVKEKIQKTEENKKITQEI